jgi:hypothetical protein
VACGRGGSDAIEEEEERNRGGGVWRELGKMPRELGVTR